MAGDGWRWADLPNDLLGTVYLRATSAYDRARFAAVCTTWRAAASCHRPLPALPLLLLSPGSGTGQREALAYSHEDGRAVHIPLQWFPCGDRLVGSHDGGWIATVSRSDELRVVNLFSGTRVPVPSKQKLENATLCARPNYSTMSRGLLSDLIYLKKVIFSADPSSTSCILAAVTQLRFIALCRVGSSDGDWTTQGWGAMLINITFCNGELYGFHRGALFKFGVDVNRDGNLVASPIHRINIEMNALRALEVTSHPRYIFQLRSKLAIAVEVWPERHDRNTKFFRVFELTNDNKMWEEVMSLDDYTLFLDPACSKAVPVSVMDGRGGVDRNCIYYSEQDPLLHHHVECLPKLYIGSCTVYYRESEDVHHLQRIISRGYHYRKWDSGNGRNCCMWLLPPEF